MEFRSFVVQRFTRFSYTLLTGAQSAKVLGTNGCDVLSEGHNDPTGWLTVDIDVKENCWICHFEFEVSVAWIFSILGD